MNEHTQKINEMYIQHMKKLKSNKNIRCARCNKLHSFNIIEYETIMSSKLSFICDECRK